MNYITSKTKNLWHRLTHVKPTHKLSVVSFFILIILDGLILMALFTGLGDHSSQLTKPDDYFPEEFRKILVEQTWDVPSQQLDSLQKAVMNSRYWYYSRPERSYAMHPLCETAYVHIDDMKNDPDLQEHFELRSKTKRLQISLTRELTELRSTYDFSLIQSLVDQNKSLEVDAMSEKLKAKIKQLDSVSSEISKLDQSILSNQNLVAFLAFIDDIDDSERQAIVSDIQKRNLLYPIYLLLYQLIFLIPLFLIAYYWHGKSVKYNRYVQALMATHLIVIVSIPVILRIATVITQILPSRVLGYLFWLLKTMHLIAIWHYLMIFFLIAIGGVIIRLVQKKATEYNAIKFKYLVNGYCHACRKKLPSNQAAFCPCCGQTQTVTCDYCQAARFAIANYCHCCGKQ